MIPHTIGELVNIFTELDIKEASNFFTNWSINLPALKLVGLFVADGIIPILESDSFPKTRPKRFKNFYRISFLSVCFTGFSLWRECFRKTKVTNIGLFLLIPPSSSQLPTFFASISSGTYSDELWSRTKFFSSIIEQDILFFDANKSGDILNRLTSDVQDFKHSIKQTISQVPFSITAWDSINPLLFLNSSLTFIFPFSFFFFLLFPSFLWWRAWKVSRKWLEVLFRSTGFPQSLLSSLLAVFLWFTILGPSMGSF